MYIYWRCRVPRCNFTRCAPQKALKVVVRCKLTFDGRCQPNTGSESACIATAADNGRCRANMQHTRQSRPWISGKSPWKIKLFPLRSEAVLIHLLVLTLVWFVYIRWQTLSYGRLDCSTTFFEVEAKLSTRAENNISWKASVENFAPVCSRVKTNMSKARIWPPGTNIWNPSNCTRPARDR